jgi:hypothetical protein
MTRDDLNFGGANPVNSSGSDAVTSKYLGLITSVCWIALYKKKENL